MVLLHHRMDYYYGGYTNSRYNFIWSRFRYYSKIFVGKNGVFKDTSGDTGDPTSGTSKTGAIDISGLDSTKFYTFYTELRLNQDNGTQCSFGSQTYGGTTVISAGTNASI